MTARRLLVWSTACITGAGCHSGDQRPGITVEDRTSRWELVEAPAWELVETFRIGDHDDPESGLTRVGETFIGPDGRLFVSQPSDHVIRVFSPDGSLSAVFGGWGTGPGEFLRGPKMGLVGDSILHAGDRELKRLSIMTLEGDLLYTAPEWATPIIRDPPVSHMPESPDLLLPDGSALVHPSPWYLASAASETGIPTRFLVLRFHPDSPQMDTVAWVERRLGRQSARLVSQGEELILWEPFPRTPLFSIIPDGSGVVMVDRDAEDSLQRTSFRVTVVSPEGDTAYVRTTEERPIPLASVEIGRSVAAEVQRISSLAERRGVPAPRASAVRRELERAGLLRQTFVPVTDLAADQEGRVWLRREDEGDRVVWTALDRAGSLIGKVRLPRPHRIVAARGEALVTLELDEWGVPFLTGYRVVQGVRP